MKNSKPRIKTVSVSELVDLPVQGMIMQVTNTRYLHKGSVVKPKWRTMKRIYGIGILIYWEWEPSRHGQYDCGFSASRGNSQGYPKIQLNLVDYNKLMKENK